MIFDGPFLDVDLAAVAGQDALFRVVSEGY
jgi:hypothetical protein